MILNIKRADPLAPDRLYHATFELTFANQTFYYSCVNLKAKLRGGKSFTKQQARIWEPFTTQGILRVFPDIKALEAYSFKNFENFQKNIIDPIVHAAGTRDSQGRLPGEPVMYLNKILLPDGNDLLEGVAVHNFSTVKLFADRLQLPVTRIPTAYSAGKPRDLALARWLANWPEATDEELTVSEDELRAALTKRMPAYSRKLFQQLDRLGYHVPLQDRPQFDEDLFN